MSCVLEDAAIFTGVDNITIEDAEQQATNRSTRSSAQSRCVTLMELMTGTSMLSRSFSSSERACTKHLNSSGDMGCPCSVPQRTSIFSESLLRSFIFADEWVYMCSIQRLLHTLQSKRRLVSFRL